MKLLVYSKSTDNSIASELGHPEYSYYFAMKAFLPVLRELGDVIVVEHPTNDAEEIIAECRKRQERCIFLSFAPPHKTPMNLACQTVPVFAWEFSTIPNEFWNEDRNNDWSYVLKQTGCAITHSDYAANAVRASMGPEFPVLAVPAPIWEKFGELCTNESPHSRTFSVSLSESDGVIDSRTIDFENLDPLEIAPPNSADYYDYAVELITKRDAELAQRNADCEYAESVIRAKDADLAKRNADCEYAESVIRAKDADLAKRNADCLYAESIVRERDAQLEELNEFRADLETRLRNTNDRVEELLSTRLGRLNARIIDWREKLKNRKT